MNAEACRAKWSNERTFGHEQWRYGRVPEGLERYGLEYRVVLHHVGGICNSYWSFEHTNCGLTKSATDFINDLRTVATNIGFDTYGTSGAEDHRWVSNGKVEFVYRDLSTGDYLTLMEARAYKNGNLHLKLNQAFIRRLNVEFGRLKGWLKDAQEAAEEMGISVDEARNCFASNLRLTARHLPLLGAPGSS